MTTGTAAAPEQPAADAARLRLIRLVHVARRELKLDDEVYRALLRSETGLESSSKMSRLQLEKVLERMKRSGFKVRAKGAGRPLDRAAVSRKVRALWLDLHAAGVVRDPSESALASWVKRETGLDDLAWASSAQASMLIERLKKWGRRAKP